MDALGGLVSGGATEYKRNFFSHVFSTSDESKAEFLNVIQYSSLGVLPVVLLNKLVNKVIPDANTDKSSLEIVLEIFLQLFIMFCGIVLIHRVITYIPTYSGFKYEHLSLTNVILAFLVLVLSIQTKIGIKTNILVDRVAELWNGPSSSGKSKPARRSVSGANISGALRHSPSSADNFDSTIVQTDVYPPAPSAGYSTKQNTNDFMDSGPMPANAMVGGSFF
jgi:hypothetical protein